MASENEVTLEGFDLRIWSDLQPERARDRNPSHHPDDGEQFYIPWDEPEPQVILLELPKSRYDRRGDKGVFQMDPMSEVEQRNVKTVVEQKDAISDRIALHRREREAKEREIFRQRRQLDGSTSGYPSQVAQQPLNLDAARTWNDYTRDRLDRPHRFEQDRWGKVRTMFKTPKMTWKPRLFGRDEKKSSKGEPGAGEPGESKADGNKDPGTIPPGTIPPGTTPARTTPSGPTPAGTAPAGTAPAGNLSSTNNLEQA